MADVKGSALSAATTLADDDLINVIDVSDTTMGAGGTNKKITKANLKSTLSVADASHTHVVADITDAGDLAAKDTVAVADITPSALVTEGEGIAANDNDTTIPTSAAVKAYADAAASGAAALDDITDVTISTPADNEVFAYDSVTSSWINQTPAEAGLAAASHTHVKANVTDLNAYEVGGTDVAVADGGTGASTASGARTNLGLGTVATLDSDTDTTLAANSDAKVATQKAVKAYVDTAVTGLLEFKGATDASANPNYPAASKGDTYVVSVAGKVGGASGKSVDIGDMYLATADNAGGTEASVGTSWVVLEHNLVGAMLAANNLSDLTNASTARSNLGVAIGSQVQAYGATLTSLEALNLVAGDILYATGADTLVRLAKGTAFQVLTMNSGATAPEWATPAGGGGGAPGLVLAVSRTSNQSLSSGAMTFQFNNKLTENTTYGSYNTSTYTYTTDATNGAGWYRIALNVKSSANTVRLDFGYETTGTGATASGTIKQGINGIDGGQGYFFSGSIDIYLPAGGTVKFTGYSGGSQTLTGGTITADGEVMKATITKLS